MRLPCSRSCASRAFCLFESRCIHQKQTPQQIVPATVIQKLIVFLSMFNPRAGSGHFRPFGVRKVL